MRAFEQARHLLDEAWQAVGAGPRPAEDADLATRAQSAELLGQPDPGPLTPAEGQASELRTPTAAEGARAADACIAAGPDEDQRARYARQRRHGEQMRSRAPDAVSAWMRFTDFVAAATELGMPTGFLQEVGADYTIVLGDADVVRPWIDMLILRRDTLDAVDELSPDLPFGERSAVYTLYHEATHAWLDLHADAPPVAGSIADGEAHFADAPLTDGRTTSDAHRLFQEAAGDYVGSRMASWWATLADLAVAASTGTLTEARRAAIAGAYEAAQSETVFGYSPEGGVLGIGADQVETERPASEELRAFLDCVLLEGKVPSSFAAVPAFARFSTGSER